MAPSTVIVILGEVLTPYVQMQMADKTNTFHGSIKASIRGIWI
jgi:hypothetical protein